MSGAVRADPALDLAVLGVRHHGVGSARAVAAALEELRPDAVLIEGPPEADPLLGLAADPGMAPPVALLVYAVDEPARSVFWPFAGFSPEWVALRYALRAGAAVRFTDLPTGYLLAAERPEGRPAGAAGAAGAAEPDLPGPVRDPIAELAAAAGRADDPDAWWEDAVEHRAPDPADPLAHFAALAEAVAELRADAAPDRDDLREAAMRRAVRAARRAGHRRIAVVCGAWHVPALAGGRSPLPSAAADDALLRGMPRLRTEATWVPWTDRRLGRAGGYGAGIASPAWYRHLFRHGAGREGLARWMADAAGQLRGEGMAVSPAGVIEAVRLAEGLAALRGRPAAGLAEALEAARSVLCEGSDVPLGLVRERLVIGESMGRVPDAVPAVPLARDLERSRRRLRLRLEPAVRELDLDLREPTGAARSVLLHRLRLLAVDWGVPIASQTVNLGTFRESWRLCWEPETAVEVTEAGVWGTTVESAAEARAADAAVCAASLGELTGLSERCLRAELPGALPAVLRAIADRAALDTDAFRLAEALPALVRAARYGDVRRTGGSAGAGRAGTAADAGSGARDGDGDAAGAGAGAGDGDGEADSSARGITRLALSLAERVCVALPAACSGLDADAAESAQATVDALHTAIHLLAGAGADPHGGDELEAGADGGPQPAGPAARWVAALRAIASRGGVPGVLRGRAVRLLLDGGWLDAEEAGRRMALVLGRNASVRDAAGWAAGFLGGGPAGGVLLLHDPVLLGLVDRWLTGLPEEAFREALPLLRRVFAGFEPGARRAVGERVLAGARAPTAPAATAPAPTAAAGAAGPRRGFAAELDEARADAVLPVLGMLLGATEER